MSPTRRALTHALVYAPLFFLLAPDGTAGQDAFDGAAVSSPDGRTVVRVGEVDSRLGWEVHRDGEPLLLPGALGFEFRDAPAFGEGVAVGEPTFAEQDEWWEQPWGQVRRVHDHHNEMTVAVTESGAPGRTVHVVVRVFDDGVGLRYRFPEQAGWSEAVVMEERTQFHFADNGRAWWIPSDYVRLDRSEMLYSSSPVSVVDRVQTPITIESTDGETALVVHEAHLEGYPRMFLRSVAIEDRSLVADLAPMADGTKASLIFPAETPWRTIQIADRVEDLQPSTLALNLNPPSRIEDTSWIEPMKYVGIWWGMHINTFTWEQGPIHGATTENTKRYIDFAAANGMPGVLVEGWNVGWDGGWITNGDVFSFTEAYPDYDLEEVTRYAREKGAEIIMHNETSGGIYNYERQLEEAFDLYESLGIRSIKSGYVADTIPSGDSHYSQEAVRHHRLVLERAAEHGIMMNVHEPIHDTGERRTWPNMMTREGSRGQEYNAWSGDGGNPPEHESILFFTRMIPGPMDFTPGIVDLMRTNPDGSPRNEWEARPRTTLAKQLALYVVLWSPMQMAADLPENYEGHPAMRWLRAVPVDWEQTVVLDAEIGDHVVVARQERGTDAWYLGAVTDERARTVEVELDFLDAGRSYRAVIFEDGAGAHWKDDPLPMEIREVTVTGGDTFRIELAPGGGQAVEFLPMAR